MAVAYLLPPNADTPASIPDARPPSPVEAASRRPAPRLGAIAAGVLFGVGPIAGLVATRVALLDAAPPLCTAATVTVMWELCAALAFVLGRRWHARTLGQHSTLVRRTMRALSEGVVVAEPDGRIALANDAAARILGPPPEDGLACRWLERARVVGPGGARPCDPARNPVVRALAGETVTEEDWQRPDGPSTRWLSVSTRPMAAPPFARPGAVMVLRDVTARRRAAAEADRLTRAVEQTADAVVITDPAGTILYVNPGFEAMTGWRRGEALGKNPRILNSGHHSRSEFERLWGTIRRGDAYRATLTNRRRDGTTYPAEQTITPIRDASGTISHFVSVSKDMTEHQRLVAHQVEMRIAAEVQRRLYPRDPPRMAGLDVAGTSVTAESAGGDYYDVLARPHGGLALLVGDVSGHGVGPALVMAEVRAYVRSIAASALDPGAVLARVDAALAPDLPEDVFVTLAMVDVHPDTRALRWANAGHVPGLVMDASGERRATLGRTGRPLGMTDGDPIGTLDGVALADGALLLLVTDGVTEALATADAPCEDDDLVALARPLRGASAETVVRELRDVVLGTPAGASRRDDVTLLAARAIPA